MPDLAHRAFDIQGARALSFVFEQGREIGVAEQVGAHAGNGEELHSGLSEEAFFLPGPALGQVESVSSRREIGEVRFKPTSFGTPLLFRTAYVPVRCNLAAASICNTIAFDIAFLYRKRKNRGPDFLWPQRLPP
jgi:hypothetical protein